MDYQTLLHSVEAYVQQEPLQSTERNEQKRILKCFTKILNKDFTITTIAENQATLLEAAGHRVPPQEDEAALALADTFPTVSTNTIIKTSDGEILLVLWKKAIEIPFGHVAGNELLIKLDTAIVNLQTSYKPPKPPPTDKRHKDTSVSIQMKGICGVYHFAWWFAKGQAKTKDPVISAHLIDTAYKNQTCIQFFRELAPFQQLLGMIYQVIDPQDYMDALGRVRTTRRNGAWSLFATSRRFPFHGLALLRNMRVRPHRDGGDRKLGFTMTICAGDFTDGYLVLPSLKIKLDFKPGDVIMFKSALLEHYMTKFEGDRTCFNYSQLSLGGITHPRLKLFCGLRGRGCGHYYHYYEQPNTTTLLLPTAHDPYHQYHWQYHEYHHHHRYREYEYHEYYKYHQYHHHHEYQYHEYHHCFHHHRYHEYQYHEYHHYHRQRYHDYHHHHPTTSMDTTTTTLPRITPLPQLLRQHYHTTTTTTTTKDTTTINTPQPPLLPPVPRLPIPPHHHHDHQYHYHAMTTITTTNTTRNTHGTAPGTPTTSTTNTNTTPLPPLLTPHLPLPPP
ncbi:hypothetical protein DFP73DRAFT_608522 [Morchella snyderi]|nr:hypothetical protein DFP73DRAFT_608522 [Morchella snyderi]